MNAPGEISDLTQLVRPHAALITEVAEAHMAGFAALKDVARAKAEIFEGLEPNGFAILPRDTRTYPFLLRRAKKYGANPIRFGTAGRPEFILSRARRDDDGTSVIAKKGRERFVFRLGTPGKHFAMNALGALAAIDAIGADLARAALALADWRPPAGRGDRHEIHIKGAAAPLLLLDDSYNANPASMKAALSTLCTTHLQAQNAVTNAAATSQTRPKRARLFVNSSVPAMWSWSKPPTGQGLARWSQK